MKLNATKIALAVIAVVGMISTISCKKVEEEDFNIGEVLNKKWYLVKIVDKSEDIEIIPERNEKLCWLKFNYDNTINGEYINKIGGIYSINNNLINIQIGCETLVYDSSGYEDKLIEALNNSCTIRGNDSTLFLYYDNEMKYVQLKK